MPGGLVVKRDLYLRLHQPGPQGPGRGQRWGWGQKGRWGDRRWRGNKRTPLPPSPPPPPPLSPLPKSPCPPRPLNSFPLKLREAWEKPFPTVTASTTPTPCSFGRSHLSLCRAQPGLLCPCRAPSLIPGACFCEWHHHPTPQAVQSSGQQLATSSRLHEATERHSPSPCQPAAGVLGGAPHTL